MYLVKQLKNNALFGYMKKQRKRKVLQRQKYHLLAKR